MYVNNHSITIELKKHMTSLFTVILINIYTSLILKCIRKNSLTYNAKIDGFYGVDVATYTRIEI